MNIGLFGFTFAHENMGCQALTCAFLETLTHLFPEKRITIINFHEEKSLGIIPELFPNFDFELYKINLKKDFFGFLKKLDECDILFDESYGDGFSDIYFTKSVFRHTIIKIIAGKSSTPFILTPQTYGPFDHKVLKWLAGMAIRNATKVYSRDSISAEFAKKISGREINSVTDLAFGLNIEDTLSDKKKLGINVSGLLWQGGFNGKENQFHLKVDYRQYIEKMIEFGIDNGFSVHLIPHVTKSYNQGRVIPDSDFVVCQELAGKYPDTVLAPLFESPYDAKRYISSMGIFVGARMHATIAAFSTGIVTIPFAYSRKFKGLYDDIGYPHYIDGTKLSTEVAVEQTIQMIDNQAEYSKIQKQSMNNIRKLFDKFELELLTLLRDK
ncbi:polysaccharide pyruvyl transferase family protein [Lacrimispora saccharolytica]|nr:polysaccharide pyruvyl transferase family protein [Lacrimispora saccharolytica]